MVACFLPADAKCGVTVTALNFFQVEVDESWEINVLCGSYEPENSCPLNNMLYTVVCLNGSCYI